MNIHLMLLLMSINVPNTPKELPLYEMPQVVCPSDMDEYLLRFHTWARNEVRQRQLERVDPLYPI